MSSSALPTPPQAVDDKANCREQSEALSPASVPDREQSADSAQRRASKGRGEFVLFLLLRVHTAAGTLPCDARNDPASIYPSTVSPLPRRRRR